MPRGGAQLCAHTIQVFMAGRRPRTQNGRGGGGLCWALLGARRLLFAFYSLKIQLLGAKYAPLFLLLGEGQL